LYVQAHYYFGYALVIRVLFITEERDNICKSEPLSFWCEFGQFQTSHQWNLDLWSKYQWQPITKMNHKQQQQS